MSTPGSDDRGVYGISVAAELVGMGVQTLRLYESRGLLEPARTEGGTRRYSEHDIDPAAPDRRRCSPTASTWPASPRSSTWKPRTSACGTGTTA